MLELRFEQCVWCISVLLTLKYTLTLYLVKSDTSDTDTCYTATSPYLQMTRSQVQKSVFQWVAIPFFS